jgi:serine/threonine-protein kinase
MPPDLLDRGRERVRIASLVLVATWLIVVVMNEGVARFGNFEQLMEQVWSRPQSLLTLAGLAAALVVAWLAGKLKDRPQLVLDLGLVLAVFNSLIVSIVTEFFGRHDPQAISWVCITIVFWPAIAPSSPRKTFAAALACATTIPIGMWIGHQVNDLPDMHWFIRLWMIVPGYICAILSVIPARIIARLGNQVRKARELGSYELQEQIGRGGMGEVYRARHRLLARPAAVKLISPAALRTAPAGENRVVIERFRREAEAAATLRSPHTIELYDYGVSDDGTFYYVMELLDGIDLYDLVTKYGPIPPERAISLLKQTCDSLGEAHLAGLVHRDVKPSNIFACRMGLRVDYVKVLDFGLVKQDPQRAPEQVHITNAGSISGTPAFMAPEAVEGKNVGPAADVYALGCLAYWLVTGENVFKAANSTMMMMQHLQSAPVPPSSKSPQPLPPDFEQIIMQCLAKDPADRPANAVELLRLLEGCRSSAAWTEKRARQWWSATQVPAPMNANMTGSVIVQ